MDGGPQTGLGRRLDPGQSQHLSHWLEGQVAEMGPQDTPQPLAVQRGPSAVAGKRELGNEPPQEPGETNAIPDASVRDRAGLPLPRPATGSLAPAPGWAQTPVTTRV